MFEKYGAITSAVVQRDEAGNSKGFGFVNFETHDEAQQAVDELHEAEHKSKKLFVTRAQKKHEREEELKKIYEQAKMEKLSKYQGVNLYVKNLEDDIDDERLRQEFQVYGVITSAKIMKDEKVCSTPLFRPTIFLFYFYCRRITPMLALLKNRFLDQCLQGVWFRLFLFPRRGY